MGLTMVQCMAPGWKVSSCKHKIFISYSRAQRPFAEQLCKDLMICNYNPFFDQRDDSLPKGQEFEPALFDAARKCALAVVVLTREYLRSPWPMLELVEFVRARRAENTNMELLPLFFEASVADLTEKSIENELKPVWMELVRLGDNVEEWATAVRELRGIQGLCSAHYGTSEVKYREGVVEQIFKLVPPELPFDTSEIVGCDRICKELVGKFMPHTDSACAAQVLGLYGPRGSGKTSISWVLYNHFNEEFFGRVCYIEIKQGEAVLERQRTLMRNLLRLDDRYVEKVRHASQGWTLLRTRMKEHPVFLIIDDVQPDEWSVEEARGYLRAHHNPASKILIISSVQEFLESFLGAGYCLELPCLTREEAAQIFFQKVVPQIKDYSPLTTLERKEVESCLEQALQDGYYSPSKLRKLSAGFLCMTRPTPAKDVAADQAPMPEKMLCPTEHIVNANTSKVSCAPTESEEHVRELPLSNLLDLKLRPKTFCFAGIGEEKLIYNGGTSGLELEKWPTVGGDEQGEQEKLVDSPDSTRQIDYALERTDESPGDDLAMDEKGYLPELPQYVLEDIFNRLEDARFIAFAQKLRKDWRDAGYNVRSVTVDDGYHLIARDINNSGKSFESDGAGPSTLYKLFNQLFLDIVAKKRNIVQLRIEVEAKLQSKTVPEGERRRTDFWLTNPYFLGQWLPGMGSTLKHLCIVDYGQQAIMRRSSIVKIISINCKTLESLDLRNMFIDTSDCMEMRSMVSLTLRCVKVVGETLQHIIDKMPKLQRLALLGVFGAEGGELSFKEMKALCLGLSTPAKDVVMNLPKLEKLQLKMQCPQKLIIEASVLKYVAFNLEVLDPSKVDLRSVVGLEELLYGATKFVTLADLVRKNLQHLKKLFLDIPCMALGEDGRFLGVLKDISLELPSFSELFQCQKLSVLNVGPGLWHSMETQVPALVPEDRWPSVQTLILHMIPHDMESAMTVLRLLLRPSVSSLTVFIHTSSPVTEELMIPRIKEIARRQNIIPDISPWTKSLDFSCFSF